MLGADELVSEANLQQALAMRSALRTLLLANNGAKLDAEDVATLNAIALSASLWVRFDSNGQARLEPAVSGVEGALSQLLAIVFSAMVDGTWTRLKACRNAACRYVFYDYSKNRSGTWCTMAICGNRLKTRKYRQRRQLSSGQE